MINEMRIVLMKKGIFITVEGTDGSGKTTQMNLIVDYLKKSGCDTVMLREPGGTEISEKIRNIILDPAHRKMCEKTEMFLYAAARAQLVKEVIKPALSQGRIVVCDRYVDSTYAYQGYGRGLDLDTLISINEVATEGTMPDFTFFFDIDPEIALSRRVASGIPDRIEIEKADFHKRVCEGYRQLSELYSQRIIKIDANRTVEQVWNDVKQELVKRIAPLRGVQI